MSSHLPGESHLPAVSASEYPTIDDGRRYPGAQTVDVAKYLPYIREIDITDEQRAELLAALWSIMSAFIELGWKIESLPMLIPELQESAADATESE